MLKNKVLKNITLLSFFFSVLATISLPYCLQLPSPFVLSGSIFSAIICMGFFFIIKKALAVKNLKFIPIYIFSLFLSVLLVLGRYIHLFYDIKFEDTYALFKFFFITLGISPIFFAVNIIIINSILNENLFEKFNNLNLQSFYHKLKFLPKLPFFWNVFLTLLLLWLPVWIVCFPAINICDTPTISHEFITKDFSNWHPVLYTLYYGYLMEFGKNVFNSYQASAILYIIPQILIITAIFAYALDFMRKIKTPFLIQLFALLFFGLNPAITITNLSIMKDVLFSGFLFLFFILSIEALMFSKKFFNSKTKIALIIISLIFTLFLRTSMCIILLLIAPIFIAVSKEYLKKTLLIFTIPLILYFSSVFIIYPFFNIKPTPPEEIYCTHIHQIIRTIRQHPESMSNNDKSLILKITAPGAIDRYQNFLLDYIKFNSYINWEHRLFDRQLFLDNQKRIFKIWLKTGLKYPLEYIKATTILSSPYWYPDYIYKLKNHSGIPFVGIVSYDENEIKYYYIASSFQNIIYAIDLAFNEYCDFVKKPIYLYKKNFILNLLFSTGLPFWILLFAIFFVCYRKQYKFLIPLSIPFIVILMFMLFSPTYLLRYNLLTIYGIPVILGIIAKSARDKEEVI